jgi:predicted Zn-dependent protease
MHLARLLADFAAQRLAPAADVFALCETAIAMDPRNAYFYLAATDAAIVVGDRARVRDFAERGVRLYPRFAPLRMHLGDLALDEGRTEDAVRMLRAAFYGDWHGKEADRSRTAASLSIALRRQGALEEGCRYAEYAVTYDPGSTRARGAFASCPQAASRGAETR